MCSRMALIKLMLASACDRQDSQKKMAEVFFPFLKSVYFFGTLCVCVCVCVCVYIYIYIYIYILPYWLLFSRITAIIRPILCKEIKKTCYIWYIKRLSCVGCHLHKCQHLLTDVKLLPNFKISFCAIYSMMHRGSVVGGGGREI